MYKNVFTLYGILYDAVVIGAGVIGVSGVNVHNVSASCSVLSNCGAEKYNQRNIITAAMHKVSNA